MKKTMLCLVLLICCSFVCSCLKEKESMSCEKIVKGAIEEVEDFPEYTVLADMSDPMWEQHYKAMYLTEPDNVEDIYAVHASDSGEEMETELAAIRYSSSETAEKAVSAMEKRKQIRYDDAKNFFSDKDYVNDIVKMVDSTIIIQDGEYIMYICCNESEKAAEYCRKQLE